MVVKFACAGCVCDAVGMPLFGNSAPVFPSDSTWIMRTATMPTLGVGESSMRATGR